MSGPPSFKLEQKQTQNLKQSQLLMMMPQMQQAIALLQAPTLELMQIVDMEMERNPLLEYLEELGAEQETPSEAVALEEQELRFKENDFSILKRLDDEFRDLFNEAGESYVPKESASKHHAYVEQSIIAPESLFEHLMEQAHQTFLEETDMQVAEIIIGSLDERGFMTSPLEEICLQAKTDPETVKRILSEIQLFDPLGVAACSTQESMLNQLALLGKKQTVAYRIVSQFYEDLLHNRLPVIHKKTGISLESLRAAIDEDISKLDLQPGAWYAKRDPIQIVPDGSILEEGGKVVIEVNDDTLPSLRINRKYLRMLSQPNLDKETKEFIHHNLTNAKWLVKNLFQRNKTLYRILHAVAERQKEWFLDPTGELVPMGMQEIADELELHESTIARAVQGKYIFTPRGMRTLRHFFTHSLASDGEGEMSVHTVRKKIHALIDKEDKAKPLSDDRISQILLEEGIHCARRTVAKYRTQLKLGNASQRRIHKKS